MSCINTIDKIANRIGLGSITLTVGTTTAQASEKMPEAIAEVGLSFSVLGYSGADIALFISAVGGVLFCIEKVFVIYLRYKSLKHPDE
jgi:hypothetical protein